MIERRLAAALVATIGVGLVACTPAPHVAPVPVVQPLANVVPVPASMQLTGGPPFVFDSTTQVIVDPTANWEAERIGSLLASMVRVHPVESAIGTPALSGRRDVRARRLQPGESAPPRAVRLVLDPVRTSLGQEGYELSVDATGVTLVAAAPNGLFYGVQTIRQLLPASVEHRDALARRLQLPAGHIVDTPRFAWRGAMLDVSRHFLDAEGVRRFIDLMALYKMNRLHLHLSDDQGWRLEIKRWPNLARFGGITEVGGGEAGFYSQDEFRDLITYARNRFIQIVPEFEIPAHINAALSAIPELNCDGIATPAYTGINVGFSAICAQKDDVYRIIDEIIGEVADLSPSPWLHIGGDEVQKLTHAEYARFVERVEQIVRAHGKQMIGWGEIAATNVTPNAIAQHWIPDSASRHVARGGKVIMSPSARVYLDMKYDSSTTLGLTWAGLISVRQSYSWDPGTLRPGVPEASILGVEAPLWSETLERLSDYEFMAFPRLAAVAEVAWSVQSSRDWDGFRARLGAHGARLRALGVNFYPDPDIPWAR
ncbi:MAG: family 20 glycosylhydrolase [Gemmatimonadaceae bacterium]